MRKFLMSAVVATVAAVSFAAPSQAGSFYFGFGGGHGHGWGGHHGGYVSHYYGHHRHCFWKKIKKYDYYGNLVIKKVKVCH